MKEILAIIPARGGSKSIPRKNIKPINGKPMVVYSIEACQKSKYITRYVVSTEDWEIKQICEASGAEVVQRPDDLAVDEAKTSPVMLHVAAELEKQGYKPDYVLLIQPTSPFRDEKFIDDALDYMFSKPDCDSCFSGFQVGLTHGYWKELHSGKFEALYDYRDRPRRQDIERHYNIFCENGAFYAVKYDVFKEVGDFIGKNPCVYATDINFDIDEPSDFEKAQDILKNKSAY